VRPTAPPPPGIHDAETIEVAHVSRAEVAAAAAQSEVRA
jgi:hypothetical protein